MKVKILLLLFFFIEISHAQTYHTRDISASFNYFNQAYIHQIRVFHMMMNQNFAIQRYHMNRARIFRMRRRP